MTSLRSRLTLAVALVLAAVIAGFSVALVSASARAADEAEDVRLDGLADRVAAAIEWTTREKKHDEDEETEHQDQHGGKEGHADSEGGKPRREGRFFVDHDLLERTAAARDVAFDVFAPGGRPLVREVPDAFPGWKAPPAKDGPESYEDHPRPSGPADYVGAGGRIWRRATVTRKPMAEPDDGAPPNFLVALGADVTEGRAALTRLKMILWILGPAVFVIGVGGVWLAVGRALRPLRAMGDAAARIDERTLASRVPVTATGDELQRLGESLNASLARLEEAFSRERGFIADASHELRTPVTILLTTLEVSLAKPRAPEEYAEDLRTLLETTRRMRGIVEALLTLARADAGRLTVDRSPVDLAGLLRRSVDELAALAAPRRVALALRADAPVPVNGDAGLLRQLFDNLVANAIRYNREGGSIEVEAVASGGRATVAVRDTGIGIAPGHLPHLFERFYRVDKGRSREEGAAGQGGGAGLGLSIAKWIADAHGGSIAVESEPGRGTTFRVTLPAEARAGTHKL